MTKKQMSNFNKNVLQRGEGKENKELHSKWILDFFPKVNRNKIDSLINFISRDNIISWNNKGEFIYKGDTIFKSNIIDLLKHVLSNSKTIPKGINQFYEGLVELNIPNYLIKNDYGRDLMGSDSKHYKSLWRPPGILDKSIKIKKIKGKKVNKQNLIEKKWINI
jgi:hypothetical protein